MRFVSRACALSVMFAAATSSSAALAAEPTDADAAPATEPAATEPAAAPSNATTTSTDAPAIQRPKLLAGSIVLYVLAGGLTAADAIAVKATWDTGACPKGRGAPADCGTAFAGEFTLAIGVLAAVVGATVLAVKSTQPEPKRDPFALELRVNPLGGSLNIVF